MNADEKWATVPPTTTTPWGITIRRADGSYREPTQEEIEQLLAAGSRLTEEEREALDDIRIALFENGLGVYRYKNADTGATLRAVAVLDKLIGAKP